MLLYPLKVAAVVRSAVLTVNREVLPIVIRRIAVGELDDLFTVQGQVDGVGGQGGMEFFFPRLAQDAVPVAGADQENIAVDLFVEKPWAPILVFRGRSSNVFTVFFFPFLKTKVIVPGSADAATSR